MSVTGYLNSLSSKLVIKEDEKEKIKKSIDTLNYRLDRYFSNVNYKNIEKKFMFGSYTRSTILPRKVDSSSDIDFMVVFENVSKYKPNTMLEWLRGFANYYYSTSEIYKSHPTIVLSLNHIKFELVPAYNSNNMCWPDYLGDYKIPAPASGYTDWMTTNPKELESLLISKNVQNNSNIKPLVRLLKYWNVLNGKIYSSYKIEMHVINQYYFDNTNIMKMLNVAVQSLSTSGLSIANTSKVTTLKSNISSILYDMDRYPLTSEDKIRKIFIDFN